MRRVVVMGSSGAGKTTLAAALARRLGVPHVELDALHWGPNWASTPTDILRWRVEAAIAGDGWTLCGNYSTLWRTTLSRADTVIWLDYPMSLALWRVLRRTIGRCVTREPLWGTNVETWSKSFFDLDSVLVWAVTTWRKRRRDVFRLFRSRDYPHLRKLRFASPRQTQIWLENLSRAGMGTCHGSSITKLS